MHRPVSLTLDADLWILLSISAFLLPSSVPPPACSSLLPVCNLCSCVPLPGGWRTGQRHPTSQSGSGISVLGPTGPSWGVRCPVSPPRLKNAQSIVFSTAFQIDTGLLCEPDWFNVAFTSRTIEGGPLVARMSYCTPRDLGC